MNTLDNLNDAEFLKYLRLNDRTLAKACHELGQEISKAEGRPPMGCVNYTLPDLWGCYMMYGDPENLSQEEIGVIDGWIKTTLLGKESLADIKDDSSFHRSTTIDANVLDCNCSTFTFYK